MVRRFTLPLPPCKIIPFHVLGTLQWDHSYILDAYLLEQPGQAHLLRRWVKQTFAASCSNGSICHKRRLTTTARMACLRVTVPIAVRHPFHSFQVLVAIRRYFWASANRTASTRTLFLHPCQTPVLVHSCIAKLPWPHSINLLVLAIALLTFARRACFQ